MTYCELHCHSYYSLLAGTDSPETLVTRAAELGLPALALTDHDAVYGAVEFAAAAQQHGLQPIFGAELTLTGGQHLPLLVENETGWGNLCSLISHARRNAPKGQASLPPDILADHTAGLIALSGGRRGEMAAALRHGDEDSALAAGRRYRDWFGPDNFWIELQHHLLPDDDQRVAQLVALANKLGLGYVATNNVHTATRAGQPLQDVLTGIRHLTPLSRAGSLLRPNSESYLKSARQLAPLFADFPAALSSTLRLAERCRFDLRYGLPELPAFPTSDGMTAIEYLRRLCLARPIDEQAQRQLAHELAIIERAGLANYFMIVWDIVRFCRAQGIRCQGRGSAANSLVAYRLGLSPIDPLTHDLVFERFLSPERTAPPDIDLDIQADRREEVIQYVYRRYGHDHAAMACTTVTFRERSARRDVARVLELPPELLADEPPTANPQMLQARDLCRQLEGLPRHLGIHNGGLVLTAAPLAERLPIEPATMPDRWVVQWDKDSLATAGLVKIDLLGLRMLSALAEAERHLTPLRLDSLTFDDPTVYEMIAAGDTLGVFQVESRAQTQLQPRLKPRTFGDLIIAISLIRPGPIQGDMVHPYLRRRAGEEPVSYAHPRLEPALKETLGVILFQEQVLKVARDLAGFSPGQGELLRLALGSKHGAAALERFRADFLTGAQANGVSLDVAAAVFEQLRAFGGYAFAKSHAAAFAVLVYQSAWLKRYQPAALLVGLLNNQPLGFWSPAVLVGDARRHGLEVLPVHITRSAAKCTLEEGRVRLGFNTVSGFGDAASARLVEARQAAPFNHLADLGRRTRLPHRLIEQLIRAGALDGWGLARRQLLWELGLLNYQADELPLELPAEGLGLPPLGESEAQVWEREVLGLSTGPHLLTRYQAWLRGQGILSTADLKKQPANRRVRVAGLVVVHQAPPTAHGVHFLTLEDSEGLVDVILWPPVYQQFRPVVRDSSLLIVSGEVQRDGDTVSLLARRIEPLSGP